MHKFIILFSFIITATQSFTQKNADSLLLKNYRPVSIYKTPTANIAKAAFPIIDMHSHDYASSPAEIDTWVKTMDKLNIKKTLILSMQSGKGFDSVAAKYSRYPTRFEVWCCFDYTGYGTPGWQKHAIEELERCYKKGARGVGELGDKGEGELYSKP